MFTIRLLSGKMLYVIFYDIFLAMLLVSKFVNLLEILKLNYYKNLLAYKKKFKSFKVVFSRKLILKTESKL